MMGEEEKDGAAPVQALAAPPEALVEAKPSGVVGAGTGLFARTDIAKGTLVAEYSGEVLTLEKAKALRDRTYLKAVTLNKHLDASKGGCLARFINDHEDRSKHNVRFEKRENRIFVVALRRVAAGEELFIDYGRGHWLFVGAAAFLGLECVPGSPADARKALRACRALKKHEVVCCFKSPAMQDVDALASHVRFAHSEQEAYNCRLKPSPFVRNTVMVCALETIAPGSNIVVRWQDRIEVKVSTLPGAGLGAFARVALPAGSVVGYYEGPEVGAAEVEAKAATFPSTLQYALRCDPGPDGAAQYVDPTDAKGQVRPFFSPAASFVNEADGSSNNCQLEAAAEGDGAARFLLRATRAVAAGEELLADFGGRLPRPPTPSA